MNIFEAVKAAVPVRQAAEHYGLKVSRNGMACCPFHNDRHPSLKLNEEYFFCFGCGAKGDVIDFAAQMFDLSSYEAAQRLAADFGISTQPGQAVVSQPEAPDRHDQSDTGRDPASAGYRSRPHLRPPVRDVRSHLLYWGQLVDRECTRKAGTIETFDRMN